MLFLVDGYNVTREDPATRHLDLREQRDGLLRRLSARGPSMLGDGRIVVVFDARDGAGTAPSAFGSVEVRYARGHSADDELVRLVERSGEAVVLVTSDTGLAERARGMARCGLEVRPKESCFDSAGRGRARKGRASRLPRDVGIPQGGNRITEELKRKWLGDAEGGA